MDKLPLQSIAVQSSADMHRYHNRFKAEIAREIAEIAREVWL
jgi:hypothetical protein